MIIAIGAGSNHSARFMVRRSIPSQDANLPSGSCESASRIMRPHGLGWANRATGEIPFSAITGVSEPRPTITSGLPAATRNGRGRSLPGESRAAARAGRGIGGHRIPGLPRLKYAAWFRSPDIGTGA
jgi:hypothetical protein